jgi:hypothetical protein
MRLDFIARGRRRRPLALLTLVVGIASAATVLLTYQEYRGRVEGLELRLAMLAGDPGGAEVPESARRSVDEVEAAMAELATPWGRLLSELEAAAAESRDSVALLEVEPDRESHRVRIVAESRTLPAAVAFAERLERSEVLRYPLLDSHEVQVKDRYRPVRFQVTASWRAGT